MEKELCSLYRVSMISVRQAISNLVDDGLLVRDREAAHWSQKDKRQRHDDQTRENAVRKIGVSCQDIPLE